MIELPETRRDNVHSIRPAPYPPETTAAINRTADRIEFFCLGATFMLALVIVVWAIVA